ncbi:hypothetical protein O6H91_01G007300 [Diphasiastrum complanatum]|uniref:Uncharacterized protein n=1 Tax=Diphasiastrum complanatum TaxID=34168 RepID=A0ACC2EMT9_DIPCM|nr:hypothetical protein O6H91_01G007300 [Diphasiastrum complanatum]
MMASESFLITPSSELSFLSPTSCSTLASGLPARTGLGFMSSSSRGSLVRREHLGKGLHFEGFTDLGRRAGSGAALVVEAARRVRSVRSLLLSSTLIAEDEMAEQVVGLCKRIVDWGREKQKDQESGVIQFDCYTDTFEKNVYHFMEVYDSFQSMSTNRASNEHTKFVNGVRPLLKEPIALIAYEFKDGQIGHALYPFGPKGEGGLDDCTGQAILGMGAKSKKNKIAFQGDNNSSKKPEDDSLVIKGEAAFLEEEKSGGWSLKKLFVGKN